MKTIIDAQITYKHLNMVERRMEYAVIGPEGLMVIHLYLGAPEYREFSVGHFMPIEKDVWTEVYAVA